ncbi:unnamed protein product, partial [Phaeothamnion confervicola]
MAWDAASSGGQSRSASVSESSRNVLAERSRGSGGGGGGEGGGNNNGAANSRRRGSNTFPVRTASLSGVRRDRWGSGGDRVDDSGLRNDSGKHSNSGQRSGGGRRNGCGGAASDTEFLCFQPHEYDEFVFAIERRRRRGSGGEGADARSGSEGGTSGERVAARDPNFGHQGSVRRQLPADVPGFGGSSPDRYSPDGIERPESAFSYTAGAGRGVPEYPSAMLATVDWDESP